MNVFSIGQYLFGGRAGR